MSTPASDSFTDSVVAAVADGTVRRVDGPQGPVFLVPAAFYRNLMADALAWRRLVQQGHTAESTPHTANDLPSTDALAAAAFGTSKP